MEFKENVKIAGIQCILPDELLGKKQKVSDISYIAAEQLISKLNWNKNDIRVLILVTQSSDYLIPSTASLLQKRLEIGYDCLVYDLNAGGDGFAKGMLVSSRLLTSLTNTGKGIIVFGDVFSNENTGNMVAAVGLEVSSAYELSGATVNIPGTFAYISQRKKYYLPEHGDDVEHVIIEAVSESGWELEDDYFLLSNSILIYNTFKRDSMFIKQDLMTNYSDNSAFIPYLLCQNDDIEKMVVITVGAGISVSMMKCILDKDVYKNIIVSNEYYEDMKEE